MPRNNLKSSLVRYARIDGIGWRRGSVITARNGRIKTDAMRYGGKEWPIDADSVYQIRYYEGNKARYTTVGAEYEAAQAALEKYRASRQLEAAQQTLGIAQPTEPEPKQKPKTLAELVNEYIAEKESPSLNLSETSIRHYKDALIGFRSVVSCQYPGEVTEADVISYIDSLKEKGYSQKTRVMRYVAVRGFLRTCGVVLDKIIKPATHKRLSAKPAGNTEPYTEAQVDRLLAGSDDYYKMVFSFLLSTGLRYREANRLTWSDVDFGRNEITVPEQRKTNRTYRDPKTGKTVIKVVHFKPKGRKSRKVPIFPSLRCMLLEWRAKHPTRVFVLGSRRSDLPDNHWLELGKSYGKRLASTVACATAVLIATSVKSSSSTNSAIRSRTGASTPESRFTRSPNGWGITQLRSPRSI